MQCMLDLNRFSNGTSERVPHRCARAVHQQGHVRNGLAVRYDVDNKVLRPMPRDVFAIVAARQLRAHRGPP